MVRIAVKATDDLRQSAVIVEIVLFAADPTGLSSFAGQLAIAAALVAAILVGVRALWNMRNRR
ncbi:MAG TPA: hypothetical protein VF444_12535 [Pseudonocardiaceae bacterium]